MDDFETKRYRVSDCDGHFEVLNESGNVVLSCADEPTAGNYAVLLNEAFQRGYKTGYRDGKKLVSRERKA